MIVVWKKDGKQMAVQVPAETQNISDMKIVMNKEWLNPPVDDPDNPVFEVVESMPEFPGGGMTAMMQLIQKISNIRSMHRRTERKGVSLYNL